MSTDSKRVHGPGEIPLDLGVESFSELACVIDGPGEVPLDLYLEELVWFIGGPGEFVVTCRLLKDRGSLLGLVIPADDLKPE